MKKFTVVLLSLLIIFLSACSAQNETRLFLGSLLTLDLSGGDVRGCENEIKAFLKEFELDISVNIDSSEISRFNAAPKDTEISLSPHVYNVFKRAVEICIESGKAFNPFMYDISVLWGFSEKKIYSEILPSEKEIQKYLPLASPEFVRFNGNSVSKTENGVKADLGGIAKGYAAGVCRDIAVRHGVTSGIINIAGNIYAIGRYNKNGENRPFKIAVTDPRKIENSNNFFAVCHIENTSVSVSGDYERYFINEGIRYCHILGTDGKPVNNGIISVITTGGDAMDTDAFSTTAMVLGQKKGMAFLNKKKINAVIITSDFKYYTCGNIELSEIYGKYEKGEIHDAAQ